MTPPRKIFHWLRTNMGVIARRMDWYRGLRAATALSTPLFLADFTGLTHLGWAGLGGIEAIVSDSGGPYRSRLGRLSVLTIGGAIAIFVGTLAGNDLQWALPVTLVFTFLWAYLPVLGQPFSSAALLVLVIYACGIGEPDPSWREALLRAAFLFAGGLWATLLSLFVWPLDPYRPARAAAGTCYHELAAFLQSIRKALRLDPSRSIPETPQTWHQISIHHKGQIRRALEKAWEAVGSVRSESSAETAQGRHLIVLLETADLILERTVALAEQADASLYPEPMLSPASQTELSPSPEIPQLHRAALTVAALLTRRKSFPVSEVFALRNSLTLLTDSFAAIRHEEDAEAHFLARQLGEIASNLDTAMESAGALRLGAQDSPLSETPAQSLESLAPKHRLKARNWERQSGQSSWNQLTGNWRTNSLAFRHALRVALVCGFDVCLIERRHFGHGYWLLLTSIVVLQPHVSGTLRRGLQRIGGTVGGGILAALLAMAFRSEVAVGAVLFPMAVLSLALLPVNYAAFSFFLTPTFVLALQRHPGDYQLAFLRIGNTIAGAAISIAAMTVLFPSFERERIPKYLRASLVANRRYLEQLIQNWKGENAHSAALAGARRATGLAHNDMEESLERVLAERWAGFSNLTGWASRTPRKALPGLTSTANSRSASTETLLAFAAYLHRVSQSITGLVTLPGALPWKSSPEVQAALAEIHSRLQALESLLTSPAKPSAANFQPLPPLPQGPGRYSLGERQLVRLERQTRVMHRHLESLSREPWLTPP